MLELIVVVLLIAILCALAAPASAGSIAVAALFCIGAVALYAALRRRL